ncbi:hypothetical protein PM3016_1458 [Paenibacillus mucilaginosus 3016]|uniref:Uncharacterized protein n=1 Tax=Paenibacillus mucilaginosus 3016 TaxID=1116391 RepID=H6NGU1_9BACL|nr:hypothetical protein [Paenibacillus mucilaginosus]AFC28383.1 hypothetical protein PM3016_1458 [Paenibacillus mucilaginosus 3016]WFA17183.1 hypothetical protein ERY13_07665 [Paenibacillus mucilaginosus]
MPDRNKVFWILSIVGFLLVIMSPQLASIGADNFVHKMGGVADKDETLRRLETYAAAYRMLGGIFLGIGLYFTFSQEKK